MARDLDDWKRKRRQKERNERIALSVRCSCGAGPGVYCLTDFRLHSDRWPTEEQMAESLARNGAEDK